MSSYSRRRTRDQLEDDNTDIDTPGLSDDSSDTQAKRPRLGSRANGGVPNIVANGASSLADFSPGSIVRVTMEDFVTYEHAEFFPGANLNMVIGPNGTGKSSLVCAICLGLGWGPSQLGRAGSFKEFVKHGKDNAFIEIELKKRPEDRLNHTIRMQIRREQNDQKWWLNGKGTNHKKVKELVAKLKIQVDNLCQFLPQDRVVEFAQCSPINLLHETLRAAAPEDMLEQQKQLKALHKDRREMAATVESDQEQFKNFENRQQGLQADVDRIREREEITANIEKLKVAHVMTSYNEARKAFQVAKQRLRDGERTLQMLRDESGPSLKAIEQQGAYHVKVRSLIPTKAKAVKEAEDDTKKLLREAEQAAEVFTNIKNDIATEQKLHDNKKKAKGDAERQATLIKAEMKNKPADFDGTEWNRKIRTEEHHRRDLVADQDDLSNQKEEFSTRIKNKTREKSQIKEQLNGLATEEGRQLNFMSKNYPDVAQAWEWIQANQDKFEQQVLGPPMITCSLKDEQYSDQVQAMMNRDDFICFTTQTSNDHKTLSHQVYKVMSLSVVLRSCSADLQSFQPPITRDEARLVGLDGFTLDYIEGPEPVLAMLCSLSNIHKSGVSLTEHDDAQYERLLNSGTINTWVAGQQSFAVRRRREYGPQAVTTVTKTIQPGRFWSDQPVDGSEKNELNRRLGEVEESINALRPGWAQLVERSKDIETQLGDIGQKIDELKAEKSALQTAYNKWQSLPRKLESATAAIDACKEAMIGIKEKIRNLQDDQDKAAIARTKAVLAHAASLRRIANAHNALLEYRLWEVEAESDIAGLKHRNSSIMKRLEAEEALLKEVAAERDRKKEEGQALRNQVKEKVDQLEQAYRDEVTALTVYTDDEGRETERTAEELHNLKEGEEAKLELIHAANPNVLREFEKRAAEMDSLRRKIEGSESKVRYLSDEIDQLRGEWEPRLEALVDKINAAFAHNFEQISCSGEVRVHKEDNFDHWAIEIMVKFRESEELQQLNSHRQSGGERAVSTIFYLMALQSMAQSPFRVVDEINQGMDPRNERMVHERMVEIACREHTSQYFLITPKLLTGLRYDPKMRILCIASGEHMPREGRKLDFQKCLKIQKGLMAGA